MATRKCKYVIIDGGLCLCPVLFPEYVLHSFFKNHNPVSAGFCEIHVQENELKVVVYGKSESLNLQAKQDDAKEIELMLSKSEML